MAKRILVVDDDCVTCDNLKLLLEDAGYTVALAHNYDTAKAGASQGKIDMVLLDMCLPDDEGLALAHWIRYGLQAPFIALVERGEQLNVVRDLNLDAEGCIMKPLNARDLLEHIVVACWRASRNPTSTHALPSGQVQTNGSMV